MNVKIYIETSLRGPAIKDGYYASVIEYQTSKGPAILGQVGKEADTTYNRSTLLAIVGALKKLKPKTEVLIYTHCAFVKNIYERGTLEDWKREEWVKPSGEEVANSALWQQFLTESERVGKIDFRFSKFNDYIDFMQEKIEERRKKEEETEDENTKKP